MIRRFLCLIGDHKWTNRFDEGFEMDLDEAKRDPVGYFAVWATSYCAHCRKVNPFSAANGGHAPPKPEAV